MKKNLLLVLMALAVTFAFVGCSKESDEVVTGNFAGSLDTLVVGTPEMNGDFIIGFGNSSYDKYIKDITGGFYGTYEQTGAGEIVLNNNVVKNVETSVDGAGNKTYTFTLHKDLKWSNGEKITAVDYVGGMLFAAAPEWATAGASSPEGDSLVGYKAYNDGDTNVFEGVKLLGEYEFSLTIAAEFLPYFWETSFVAAMPRAASVYFPGIEIISDSKGAKFDCTSEELLATCNNIAATERFAPTVTCGPYKFVSFENQTVTCEINEYFKGDINGNKPTIKYIVQKAIPQNTDIDAVIAGDVDLITGVIEGAKIEKAKASPDADMNSYLRAGYGGLYMHCDWGIGSDANVRWAMASLIDRNEVIDYVLGGYGGTVDSAFGLAQWVYQERQAEMAEALKPISFNIDLANDYLDESAYKFEADGKTAFDRSKANAEGTYLRHNAKGEAFIWEHLGTTDNTVTDIIEIQYTANAPLAGIKFNVTKSDFNALLDNYYYCYELGPDRKYNSFNLASNFTAVFDPYYSSFHSDYFGSWENSNQVNDPELDDLIMKLRSYPSTEREAFADTWVEYQTRLQEILPLVPLYSNEYFDVYYKTVHNVETTPYDTWASAVCKITKEVPAN